MIATFFVVGVQKGGTKALDQMLRGHPGVGMAAIKEPHFFDNERVDWTRPDYSRFHAFFDTLADRKVHGEATPIYSYWPQAIERIAAYNQNARIIMLLRHPTFRAYSQWRMQKSRRAEPLSFSSAIGDIGRTRVMQSHIARRRYSYVERGFYSLQVERLLRVIPRANVLFIRTDLMWLDPEETMSSVASFLNLDAHGVSRQPRYVSSPGSRFTSTIDLADRRRLDRVFGPDIMETARITGLDLSDWLTSYYEEPMKKAACIDAALNHGHL